MAIRILEEDEREKYEARRREMVLSHTTVIMNGLLETPEAQEERERKARRDVLTEAREVADRAEREAQCRKWKEVHGCDISIDHVVDAEKSALREVSSDSSLILPSQMVSDILKHMLLLNKDAKAQVFGCRSLLHMIDAKIGTSTGCAPNFGGWAHAQAIVAEAGTIEIVLEAMRVHNASEAVRLAGMQLLGALAIGNQTNRTRIGSTKGIDALLFGVRPDMSDLRSRSLTATGCLALRNVAVEHADNLKTLVASRGIQFLVAALRVFADSQEVQVGSVLAYCTCVLLRKPAPDTRAPIAAQEGAIGLLRSMAQSNPEWRKSLDNLGYRTVLRRHATSTNVFPVGAGTTTSLDSVSPAHCVSLICSSSHSFPSRAVFSRLEPCAPRSSSRRYARLLMHHACTDAASDACTIWMQNDEQLCRQDTQAIGSGTVQKLLGERETCT